jgi:hypothetical protein
MAKVFDGEMRVGLLGRYPWKEWFDGQKWQLDRGTDFHVSVESFRPYIYTAASRLGFKVHTQKLDEESLVLQATKGVRHG